VSTKVRTNTEAAHFGMYW